VDREKRKEIFPKEKIGSQTWHDVVNVLSWAADAHPLDFPEN
jgi:hypothetical protein